MTQIDITAVTTSLDLQQFGNTVCGVVGKWPIMISPVNPNVDRLTITLDRKKSSADMKSIKAFAKQWGVSAAWTGENLQFTMSPKKVNKHGTYVDFIRALIGKLNELGLNPQPNCPICGQPYCDAVSFVKGGYRQVHRSCLQAGADKAKEYAEKNQQNGSYVMGIVGAVIGMIVGTIPTFLTILFMEMEYSVLFALIPICAYFGYKLFGGKMNKVALIVSIIMAIIGVYVLNFELVIAQIMQEYEVSLSDALSVLPMLIGDPEVWVELTTGSLTEFLFSALGVWVAWRFISGTAADTADNAEAMVKLAQPYPKRPEGFEETIDIDNDNTDDPAETF